MTKEGQVGDDKIYLGRFEMTVLIYDVAKWRFS